MNTSFKENNRFSFLMNERKLSVKKDKERERDQYNGSNDLRNDLRNELRREREQVKVKKQNVDLSSVVDFPELVKPKATVNTDTSFLDKLKMPVKIKPQNQDTVPLGWIKMKMSGTNKTTVVSNPFPVINKSSEELAYDVLSGLVRLHEKRTQEYINDWGYENWDHEFCFQNYDYGYFDRLDEIYEINNPEPDDGSDSENSLEEEEYWKKY